MTRESLDITVEAEDAAASGSEAQALADRLREADGVEEASRRKADPTTMDLGAIVQVVVTSGAMLAIAEGIAAWLRARRGTRLIVERDGQTGSLKAEVEGIDPDAALQIVELVRRR